MEVLMIQIIILTCFVLWMFIRQMTKSAWRKGARYSWVLLPKSTWCVCWPLHTTCLNNLASSYKELE